MPLLLIVLGIGLIVVGARGKTDELVDILKEDFTSSNNFVAWLMAFGFIGAVGSMSETFRPVVNAFSALILITILLTNKGFFAEFERQALK